MNLNTRLSWAIFCLDILWGRIYIVESSISLEIFTIAADLISFMC